VSVAAVSELPPLEEAPVTLTVEEAARYLRIGRAAGYAAVKAKEIPSVKLGRSIRIPRRALLELLGEPDPSPKREPDLSRAQDSRDVTNGSG
jgi:excisionase family DNA binding protein